MAPVVGGALSGFEDWFRHAIGLTVLVFVAAMIVAVAVLPLSAYWLTVGALWLAALLVRALAWGTFRWIGGHDVDD